MTAPLRTRQDARDREREQQQQRRDRDSRIAAYLVLMLPAFQRAAMVLLAIDVRAVQKELAPAVTLAEWQRVIARRVAFYLAAARTSAFVDAWARKLTPLMMDAYTQGAGTFADLLTTREVETMAATYARNRAREVAAVIGNTNADRLMRAARWDGIKARPTGSAVAQAFTGEDGTSRAERIATIEASAALAAGEFDGARVAGYTEGQWNHDGNPTEPRIWHITLDGRQQPLGDVWPGTTVRFPRDPQGELTDTAGCTCSMRYQSAD